MRWPTKVSSPHWKIQEMFQLYSKKWNTKNVANVTFAACCFQFHNTVEEVHVLCGTSILLQLCSFDTEEPVPLLFTELIGVYGWFALPEWLRPLKYVSKSDLSCFWCQHESCVISSVWSCPGTTETRSCYLFGYWLVFISIDCTELSVQLLLFRLIININNKLCSLIYTSLTGSKSKTTAFSFSKVNWISLKQVMCSEGKLTSKLESGCCLQPVWPLQYTLLLTLALLPCSCLSFHPISSLSWAQVRDTGHCVEALALICTLYVPPVLCQEEFFSLNSWW